MISALTHRPKIVVFGLYKTGTTALFSNLRNSVNYLPRLLVVPKAFKGIDEDVFSGVLAKVILGESDTDYASFAGFE